MSTSSPNDRKIELEKKKQKLAEIREEKKRLEAERRRSQLPNPDGASSTPSSAPPSQAVVDSILNEFDLPAPTRESTLPPPIFSASPSKPKTLQVSQTVQVDLPSNANNVVYGKSTQTDDAGGGKEFHGGSLDFWEEDLEQGGHGSQGESDVFNMDESPTHQIAKLLPHLVRKQDSHDVPPAVDVNAYRRGGELNEALKQEILNSTEFLDFFDRQSRIVERSIEESTGAVFMDYASTIDTNEKRRFEDDADILVLHRKLFVDRLDLKPGRLGRSLKGRSVSSIDQSSVHPELIAVGYTDCMYPNASDANKDGVVCIWNTALKKDTPEYTFFSPSPVTSVVFAKFHANLIVAGTYSGRIHLWNNREHKKTPVQRSPLTTTSHTQPVYSASIQGTANANNLITVSSDGKMCAWNVEMLQEPQETIDLTWNVTKSATSSGTAAKGYEKQVPITCMSFPVNSVNNFVVGSEDGCVYSGQRHGQRAGISTMFAGHAALVSSIDFHRALGTIDFSHLFLTSSCDWTVKLWSTKETKALHTFTMFNNYVVDVKWCPTNPSVFACIDCAGTLHMYNLTIDTDTPIFNERVIGTDADVPVNRLQWAANADGGMQLLVGTQLGTVWVFDVNTHLCATDTQEWQRLADVLDDVARQHDDGGEEVERPAMQSTIAAGMPSLA